MSFRRAAVATAETDLTDLPINAPRPHHSALAVQAFSFGAAMPCKPAILLAATVSVTAAGHQGRHGPITRVAARTTTLADRVVEVSMDIRHASPIDRVGNAAMHAASPRARSACTGRA